MFACAPLFSYLTGVNTAEFSSPGLLKCVIVCLRIATKVGHNWCYRSGIFALSLQTEKSAEGAGPLRSVKSDGQADERTATVNSVSQIISRGQDQRISGLPCVRDSYFKKQTNEQKLWQHF